MNGKVTTLLLASSLIAGCASADPPVPLTDPPPITGGTLSITPDGVAVAADTDRDVVWLADLRSGGVRQVVLVPGDQPGRVSVDAAGRAHVVLRGAGAVARIDPRSGTLLDRRQVCPAPRGIAYEAARDAVHVACAGGELVTLPAAGGAAIRSLRLDRDLRDVVVQGGTLLVSRFRTPELLAVGPAGEILGRQAPPPASTVPFADDTERGAPVVPSLMATPTVAWRTLALPGGGVAMVHQMASTTAVDTVDPGGYGWGNACSNAIVVSTVTFFESDGSLRNALPMPMLTPVLPVDLAADAQGNIAIVSAGDMSVVFPGTRANLETSANADACAAASSQNPAGVTLAATPLAVASWQGRWFVQTREQAAIVEIDASSYIPQIVSTVALGGSDVGGTGNSLFHTSWTGVACASCHPEGGDDGHTWLFDVAGARRTQSLSGGVMHRGALHWRGEFPTFPALVDEVLVSRMEGGNDLTDADVTAFARWLDGLPAPAPSPAGTTAQIEHGRQIFQNPVVGCAGCHAGAYLTNGQRVDVGTGASFQVPSLVGVASRAPFLHDGCAATLQDRFDPAQAACNGGDRHGQTSQLSAADVGDLIAYLETL